MIYEVISSSLSPLGHVGELTHSNPSLPVLTQNVSCVPVQNRSILFRKRVKRGIIPMPDERADLGRVLHQESKAHPEEYGLLRLVGGKGRPADKKRGYWKVSLQRRSQRREKTFLKQLSQGTTTGQKNGTAPAMSWERNQNGTRVSGG